MKFNLGKPLPLPVAPPMVRDPFDLLLAMKARLIESRTKLKSAEAECAAGADGTDATVESFKVAAQTLGFWRASVSNIETELAGLRAQIAPAGFRLCHAVSGARRSCLEALKRLAGSQLEPLFPPPKSWKSCLEKVEFERRFAAIVAKSPVVIEERRRQVGWLMNPDDFKSRPEDFLGLVEPYRLEEARCIAKIAAVDGALRTGGTLEFDDDIWSKKLPDHMRPSTLRLDVTYAPPVSEAQLLADHTWAVKAWLNYEQKRTAFSLREVPEDPRRFNPAEWAAHCAKMNRSQLASR